MKKENYEQFNKFFKGKTLEEIRELLINIPDMIYNINNSINNETEGIISLKSGFVYNSLRDAKLADALLEYFRHTPDNMVFINAVIKIMNDESKILDL